MSRIRESLNGRVFGRLTVSDSSATTPGERKRTICTCVCSCGNILTVLADALRSGNTKSCGCLRREVAAKQSATHGKSRSPEYRIRLGMIGRCENTNYTSYHHYGSRGITVCPSWRESFEAFFADMGPRPSASHELERRDNNIGYTPDNCYWATRQEQCNNTRHNRYVTWRGETHTTAEWSRLLSIPRTVITNRLYRQWSLDRVFAKPK